MLSLNFSRLVHIGLYTFETEGLRYKHNLFITEDATDSSKYYLVDIAEKAVSENSIDDSRGDLLLESLCICELSIKKDIPYQIASFLERLGFITDKEEAIKSLENINISFFEVRYNFYKNGRECNVENSCEMKTLCTFYKVQKIKEDGSFGAIVEDIGLLSLKRAFYSIL